jgi:hypothetical protein
LIYLEAKVISEAGFNFKAVSGLYDGGVIYLDAFNQLHGIHQTKSMSDGTLQGTFIEHPVAALEKIIEASRESVRLARDASNQLDASWAVVSRCRCDAILLHGRRVRFVKEREESHEGRLFFEIRSFTIQEVGKERLSFYFNDADFVSGNSRFELLEEETRK